MKKILTSAALAALALTTAALTATGCSKDNAGAQNVGQTAKPDASVLLKLRFPGTYAPPTRAQLTEAEELVIDSIDVLVFETTDGADGTTPTAATLALQYTDTRPFSDVAIAWNAETSRYEGTFNVSLKATPEYQFARIVVLANSADVLATHGFQGATAAANHTPFAQGALYSAVSAGMWSAVSDDKYISSNANYIPMWGETSGTDLVLGTGATTIPAIALTRSLARIDIGVGHHHRTTKNGVNAYTWDSAVQSVSTDYQNHPLVANIVDEENVNTNTFVPFALTDIYVVRPENHFMPIPTSTTDPSVQATNETTGAGLVSVDNSLTNWNYARTTDAATTDIFSFNADSLAAVSGRHTMSGTRSWSVFPAGGTGYYGGSSTRSIYLPESNVKVTSDGTRGDANHTARTALVVGGYYDPAHNSTTKTYYRVDFIRTTEGTAGLVNILRNHNYVFDITSVSGPGMDTAKKAYESRVSNMTVEITDWTEEVLDEVTLN